MNDDANDPVSGTAPGDTGAKNRDNPPRNSADRFRLRPERPRVMRLSRKVLAALAGVASLAILGALIWALDSGRRGAQPPQELFNTANKTTADGLAALPKDYTGIPQLGPPCRAISAGRCSMPTRPFSRIPDLTAPNNASRRKARRPAPANCSRQRARGKGLRPVRR